MLSNERFDKITQIIRAGPFSSSQKQIREGAEFIRWLKQENVSRDEILDYVDIQSLEIIKNTKRMEFEGKKWILFGPKCPKCLKPIAIMAVNIRPDKTDIFEPKEGWTCMKFCSDPECTWTEMRKDTLKTVKTIIKAETELNYRNGGSPTMEEMDGILGNSVESGPSGL